MLDIARRQRPALTVELTPLIDVVFQLLVFFLLTSVFLEPALPMNLPAAETAEVQQAPAELVIDVEADGTLRLDGREMPLATLRYVLRIRRATHTGAVSIRGHRDARYGALLEVLDTCRVEGFRNVALATTQGDLPEPSEK